MRGGTTEQAASRLANALSNGFMRNPDVAVEVDQYRPFYIQGEVRNSGQFPYVYGMTVRAAISTCTSLDHLRMIIMGGKERQEREW